MAVTDPRCKLVTLLLSTPEYAEVEDESRTQGYRSLSSFARSAVLAFALAPKSGNGGESADPELRIRLEQLATELKRLSQRFGDSGS